MNIVIRGWIDEVKVFQDRLKVEDDRIDSLLQHIAVEHAEIMKAEDGHWLIEIEFLDELNPEKRFFRVGTDPSSMVEPFAIRDGNLTEALRKWKG